MKKHGRPYYVPEPFKWGDLHVDGEVLPECIRDGHIRHLVDYTGFEHDTLYCEYVYLIDFQEATFELGGRKWIFNVFKEGDWKDGIEALKLIRQIRPLRKKLREMQGDDWNKESEEITRQKALIEPLSEQWRRASDAFHQSSIYQTGMFLFLSIEEYWPET